MRCLFVLLALMATAHGQALSYIGLCNKTWDCKQTLAGFDKRITTGWLEVSFGHRCECADRILQSPKPKTIRVHLINSPCMRNKRCQRHDVLYGYTVASANRALGHPKSRLLRKFNHAVLRLKRRLEKAQGRLTCYVSPCLECDLGHKRKTLFTLLRSLVPNCNLVDNPLRGQCLGGTICERHGTDTNVSNPCLYDLDGTHIKSVSDLESIADKVAQCDVKFYWESWMNCNEGSQFIPPSKRRCNITKRKIDEAKRLSWKLS